MLLILQDRGGAAWLEEMTSGESGAGFLEKYWEDMGTAIRTFSLLWLLELAVGTSTCSSAAVIKIEEPVHYPTYLTRTDTH